MSNSKDIPDPRKRLKALLSEPLDQARVRAVDAWPALSKGKKLVLFGAGQLGRSSLRKLIELEYEVVAFCDNNPALWGRTVQGVEILSPATAAERYSETLPFVVSIWRAEGTHRFLDTREQLKALGIESVVHLGVVFWHHPETFLPYFAMDLPHKVLESADSILKAFDLFQEPESQQEFVAQIAWRLSLDFECLRPPCPDPEYFIPSIFPPIPGEGLVDGGAFDGDSFSHFAAYSPQRGPAWLFEPDPGNFEALNTRLAALGGPADSDVQAFNQALGRGAGWLDFEANGTASARVSSKGGVRVPVVALDDVLPIDAKALLKLDIEGAEREALEGAQNWIRNTGPRAAICVYHCQDHLWRIPLLLHELRPDYRMVLRCHSTEIFNTICYAQIR
jgi:FkbM family methyltransferase